MAIRRLYIDIAAIRGQSVFGYSGSECIPVGYGYDGSGNLTSFQDATGQITKFSYVSPGQLTWVMYPSHPGVTFVYNAYDSLGRVKTQADAVGHVSTFYFAGSRTEIDDPSGAAQVFYFSPRGKVLSAIDALGNVTASTYDGLDRQVTQTLPEGNRRSVTYDARSNPLTITMTPKPGSPLSASVQSFTYDPTYNKVVTGTDALGRVTTNSYDAATGNLLSTTGPAVAGGAPRQTFTYNGVGQRTSATDPTNRVTQYNYAAGSDQLQSVVEDAGGLNLTTRYGYDAVGNVTSWVDANGNGWAALYDGARRRTAESGPGSMMTQITYDADGNEVQRQRATGNTSSPWLTQSATYSASFKTLTSTDPAGNVTSYGYDSVDRLSSVTDAEGRTTRYAYDGMGRKTSVIRDGIQGAPLLQYSYTANGLPRSQTDARGYQTSYVYDGLDRLSTVTYANGSRESYSYDAVGNVTGKTLRDGSQIGYGYDALNRVTSKTATGESAYGYGYDLAGRRTSASNGAMSLSYGYSGGRLMSVTRGDGKGISYQYDGLGHRTRLTWPDGYAVIYAYDGLGRMTGISEAGGSALASYSYDPLGRRTAASFGNGTSASYGYGPGGDLGSLSHVVPGGQISYGFSYNRAHQLSGETISDAVLVTYPSSSLSRSYAANALNQYSAVGGAAPGYDGRGNLTSDGQGASYTYDTENHLLSASTGSHRASYGYDPQGRRSVKTVDGLVTQFLSDGDQEIAEYDGGGTLLRRYIHGSGLDEPVVTIDVSGGNVRRWSHADARGSVVMVTGATGAVTDKYAYDPYGDSGVVAGAAFRFAGRRLDAETGLYYNRARMYSPALGRFLQPDPIGYAGGANLYAYVGNDPVNQVDPTGLYANQVASGAYDLMKGQIAVLPQIGSDISNLLSNPSQIPNAVGSAAPGIAPVAGELPAVVTQAVGYIRTFNAASTSNPYGIPDNYVSVPSDKGGGTKYVDPNNPHNYVRDMPGNPNSPNPAQQNPYVVDMRFGTARDLNGNSVSPKTPDAHIPANQYWYVP